VATGMVSPGVVLWYAKQRGRLCRACFEKLTARPERRSKRDV